jgi:hypothetical protein
LVLGAGTVTPGRQGQQSVDDEERKLSDGGVNPDDPAVLAAIDNVRWESALSCVGGVDAGGQAEHGSAHLCFVVVGPGRAGGYGPPLLVQHAFAVRANDATRIWGPASLGEEVGPTSLAPSGFR